MKPINCNVIVHATDTDVFFLLLKHCNLMLCHNLYISLVRGFVNITTLMNKLGVKASYALLSLHAITGCDTVNKFNGVSTEYWFKRFFENHDNHAKLKNELVKFQTAEGLTEETESPGLQISVGYRTMTDRNKCLTDLKPFQSDIVSKRKIKT